METVRWVVQARQQAPNPIPTPSLQLIPLAPPPVCSFKDIKGIAEALEALHPPPAMLHFHAELATTIAKPCPLLFLPCP